jgi:hypothetical protein
MAHLVVLAAGLLVVAESQAGDIADRAELQGFLSKYIPSESDASKISHGNTAKFITLNSNHMKQGHGSEALSHHNNLAEHGPAAGYATANEQDIVNFASTKREPSMNTKDFDIPKNAAKEEVRDAQKLLANDSNTQISLSAVGVGLLASVMMLGVHLRRWLQPGTIVASSSVGGSDMSINMVPAFGDSASNMEMKSQGSNTSSVGSRMQTDIERRSALSVFTSTAAMGAVLVVAPRSAAAEQVPNGSLMLILRVKEAAAQEIRLVKSGKFKDLQRASIKLAVNLMLNNYQLNDNVNKAAVLAGGSKSFAAQQAGQGAVESLTAVLEYFDAGSNSLKVDSISGEKLDFVIKALDTTRKQIDQFLSYMPEAEVAKCIAVIDEENEANVREYAEFNPDAAILNPDPEKKVKVAPIPDPDPEKKDEARV